MNELKNKIVVITGATQGIGFGIASAFAKEGANVVVSARDQKACEKVAENLRKMGVKSLGLACDVSKKDEVDNLFDQTVKKMGKPDILVNNAGIFPFVPFDKMTEDDWEKVIDVNLKSIFLCCQAVSKKMKNKGKIINISSIASVIAFEGLVHYCASKGGINSMTRALALELANKKINVNAIAPGAIETPGTKKALTEEMKKGMISKIPLGHMGKPEDIAQTAIFLASEKSSYITGQTLIVDGGWTLH